MFCGNCGKPLNEGALFCPELRPTVWLHTAWRMELFLIYITVQHSDYWIYFCNCICRGWYKPY